MRAIGKLALHAAVAAVAVWGTLNSQAHASTVTSTTSSAGGTTTVNYSVTAAEGETIRDFHVWVDSGKVTGTPSGPTRPAGTPPAPTPVPGWTSSKKSGGVNWKCPTGTPITSANSPATFTIAIPTSQFTDGIVKWTTTSDGNDDRTNGVIDTGPGEGEGSTHGPIAAVTVTENDAPINATTTFPVDSTEPSTAYRVFAVSTSTDLAPDPFSDYAGFVTWANQHPVPASWNLTFQNLTGTTDSNGDTTQPRVVIPNTSSLIGEKFWIVVVVDSTPDDDEVVHKIASPDYEIEIKPAS